MTLNFIKYPGGKFYLHRWIIGNFPAGFEQMHYVEPFGGGATVLLNKPPSLQESLNDFDPALYSLYDTIKYRVSGFVSELRCYEYKKSVFEGFRDDRHSLYFYDRRFKAALKEFVIRRMSRGGYGKDFAWSNRTRGGIPGDVNAWKNAIENLFEVSKRLQNVNLSNEDVFTLLSKYNNPNTFFYLDPEYVDTTLVSKNPYRVKFDRTQHVELCEILATTKSTVAVSNYGNEIYDTKLKDWNRCEKQIASHAGQGRNKKRKVEVLWKNY